jgi:transcriptional regulator with XRE-family HTH domain
MSNAKPQLDHEPAAVEYARRKAGLSKTALAQRLGVSLSLISMIETGDRNATPALLLRMADALNCPVVVLESKRQCVPASDANGSAA